MNPPFYMRGCDKVIQSCQNEYTERRQLIIMMKEFYFLRHGQTDHNLYNINHDPSDIELNPTGILQALRVQKILSSIKISTVCCSPLKRAQQTKEIALREIVYNDVIVPEIQECSGTLWELLLEWGKRDLVKEEWDPILEFTERVERGLKSLVNHKDPCLIVAHGGTYWAICHLLGITQNRHIDNCQLVKFHLSPEKRWMVTSLNNECV